MGDWSELNKHSDKGSAKKGHGNYLDTIKKGIDFVGGPKAAAELGASMLPGVGEAMDVRDLYQGYQESDYSKMGWAGAGLALPASGKALKETFDHTKKWIHGTDKDFDQMRPFSHFGTPGAANVITNTSPEIDYIDWAKHEMGRFPDRYRGMSVEEVARAEHEAVTAKMRNIPTVHKKGNAVTVDDSGTQNTYASGIAQDLRDAGHLTREELQEVVDARHQAKKMSDGQHYQTMKLQDILREKDIDYIDYVNKTEDKGSTSRMVVDPERSVRSPTAEFKKEYGDLGSDIDKRQEYKGWA